MELPKNIILEPELARLLETGDVLPLWDRLRLAVAMEVAEGFSGTPVCLQPQAQSPALPACYLSVGTLTETRRMETISAYAAQVTVRWEPGKRPGAPALLDQARRQLMEGLKRLPLRKDAPPMAVSEITGEEQDGVALVMAKVLLWAEQLPEEEEGPVIRQAQQQVDALREQSI